MPQRHRSRPSPVSAPLILAAVFWAALVLTGGASRADALGQLPTRAMAALVLLIVILWRFKVDVARDRAALAILAAMAALLVLQLVPLPASVWTSLPGREGIARIALLTGEPQIFRPISMSPDATLNALFSLSAPITMAVVVACLSAVDRARLVGVVLAGVMLSAFVGAVQFTGAILDNPFINDTPGASSGMFANRNHQALFLAIGILLAPCWAFIGERSKQQKLALWRPSAAAGLMLLFALMILATGSRAGLLLAAIAIVLAPIMVWREVARLTAGLPRWVLPTAIAGLFAAFAVLFFISISAGRAVSFNRVVSMDVGEDMRTRGLPVVLEMIRTYFPVGTGAGTFDPLFRMHEPFALLKLTYFNHAHDDYLEILLDTGLAGGVLLLIAVAWWGLRSIPAWRMLTDGQSTLSRLGSGVILLTLVASAVDYPARTPIIMAVLAIASAWLVDGGARSRPLRTSNQHL